MKHQIILDHSEAKEYLAIMDLIKNHIKTAYAKDGFKHGVEEDLDRHADAALKVPYLTCLLNELNGYRISCGSNTTKQLSVIVNEHREFKKLSDQGTPEDLFRKLENFKNRNDHQVKVNANLTKQLESFRSIVDGDTPEAILQHIISLEEKIISLNKTVADLQSHNNEYSKKHTLFVTQLNECEAQNNNLKHALDVMNKQAENFKANEDFSAHLQRAIADHFKRNGRPITLEGIQALLKESEELTHCKKELERVNYVASETQANNLCLVKESNEILEKNKQLEKELLEIIAGEKNRLQPVLDNVINAKAELEKELAEYKDLGATSELEKYKYHYNSCTRIKKDKY